MRFGGSIDHRIRHHHRHCGRGRDRGCCTCTHLPHLAQHLISTATESDSSVQPRCNPARRATGSRRRFRSLLAAAEESLVAVDIRPKPVQIPSHDLLTLDNQAVRVALAGEFRVADPARYVCENSNSGGAFFLALEQALPLAVAEYSLDALLRNPSVLAKRIQERVEPRAAQLGLKLTTLEVLNALALYVKSPAE